MEARLASLRKVADVYCERRFRAPHPVIPSACERNS